MTTALLAPPAPGLPEHLTARLEQAVHRHLSVAQDWLPHEYVPWEQTQGRLAEPVRAAACAELDTRVTRLLSRPERVAL